MYGLVNAAIQEMICNKHGKDKWIEIKKAAGVQIEMFSRMDTYPDDISFKLIGAASKVLGAPADEIIAAFGEFWVLYTGKEGYGHLFGMAGNSLKDFLFNLDNLHTRVGQNFTELQPPSFRFDTLGPDHLRMHYYSERAGLCPMIFGLVRGLSVRFKTEVQIEHPVCSRNGADHCEFLLQLAPKNG